tara:strand:- start:247 stop:468 length:222 start_codon:yes stop_codon:yes gene_type:complete
MSRQGFCDFIRACEHSHSLRLQISKSNNLDEIISIANKYGFCLTQEDIKNDSIADQINNWFQESKISEIRKLN